MKINYIKYNSGWFKMSIASVKSIITSCLMILIFVSLFSISANAQSFSALRYPEFNLPPHPFDPYQFETAVDLRVADLTGSSMITFINNDMFNPVAQLARSFRKFNEGTLEVVYEIKLREDVRWSDWSNVKPHLITADDVIFSIERIKKDPTLNQNLRFQISNLIKWKKVDDTTMHLTFENKHKATVTSLNFKITPELDALDSNPVSGPFIFETIDEGRRVAIFSRNPRYFNSPKPMLGKVEIWRQSTVAGMVDGLKNGRFGILFDVPHEQYVDLVKSPYFEGTRHESRDTFGAFVFRIPNIQTRKAMILGFDRETVYEAMGEKVSRVGSFVSTQYDEYFEPYHYDVLSARRLLENVDLPEFTLKYCETPALSSEVVQAFVNQMKLLGITVKPISLPWRRFSSEVLDACDFDIAFVQWRVGENADFSFLFSSEGAGNIAGFSDPRADRLLEYINDSAKQSDERKRNLVQLHNIVRESWSFDIFLRFRFFNVKNVALKYEGAAQEGIVDWFPSDFSDIENWVIRE